MRRLLILPALLFLAMLFMLPEESVAQTDITTGWNPTTSTCTMRYREFQMGEPGPTLVKDCIEGRNLDGTPIQMGDTPVTLGVMSSAICVVRAIMSQSMFHMYCAIANNMWNIFMFLFTIYVILYGMSFIFGLADVEIRDFGVRLIKIMILMTFAMNPTVFYTYFYSMWFGFLDGVADEVATLYPAKYITAAHIADFEEQKEAFSGQNGGPGYLSFFWRVDLLFEKLAGQEKIYGYMLLAITFLFSGPGFWVGLLVMAGVLTMITAIVTLVVTYATAVIAITYLLLFTPIFFSFALFKPTQRLFNSWLAALISYTLQPLIIYIFIMVIGVALDAGDDLDEILAPADTASCIIAEDYRDDVCTAIPSDPADISAYEDGCKTATENVRDACFSQLIDMTTKQEWKIGSGVLVIEDVPKFINGSESIPRFPDVDPEQVTDDPAYLNSALDKALPAIIAFIFCSAIISQFLGFVPTFAQRLAQWQSQRATPVIGKPVANIRSLSSGQSGTFGIANWITMSPLGAGGAAKVGAVGVLGYGAKKMFDSKGKRETTSRDKVNAPRGMRYYRNIMRHEFGMQEESDDSKALRGSSAAQGLANITGGKKNSIKRTGLKGSSHFTNPIAGGKDDNFINRSFLNSEGFFAGISKGKVDRSDPSGGGRRISKGIFRSRNTRGLNFDDLLHNPFKKYKGGSKDDDDDGGKVS